MLELTAEEMYEAARKVVTPTKKEVKAAGYGRAGWPNYINTEEELIEYYRKFVYEYQMQRLGEDHPHRAKIAEMCAEMCVATFKEELPGLTLLFKQYLRQH